MATNHTENYNLNLWEPTDSFLRSEFNENFNKLDTALKAVDTKADGKASTAALNALTQTVNTKGNCRIVVGTYTGTGTYGPEHPTVINVPAVGSPLVIFIWMNGDINLQRLIRNCDNCFYTKIVTDSHKTDFTWTDAGVKLVCESSAFAQMNAASKEYTYIAIGC